MHELYRMIATRVGIPFFHLADALGHALAADGLTRVGLLGTRFTMVEGFYATRLREGFGIDVILPDEGQIGRIDAVIFDELCRGIVEDSSRNSYLQIVDGSPRGGGPGASSLAVPRSRCWSSRSTTSCRCMTRRFCMHATLSSGPCRATDNF